MTYLIWICALVAPLVVLIWPWKARDVKQRRCALRKSPATAPKFAANPITEQRTNRPTLEQLEEIWEQAVTLDDPCAEPVHRYLRSRQLGAIPLWPALRCHPKLGYYERDQFQQKSRCIGSYPVLLARLTHPLTGQLSGLQHTYLTEEGSKAPVLHATKLLIARGMQANGSVICLMTPNTTLGLAVGLSRACAVYLATGMPVWALPSLSFMDSLVIPPHVEFILIWAALKELTTKPKDLQLDAGRDYAERLAARLRAEHRNVQVLYPMLGRRPVDWNDVWQEQGAAGFPILQHQFSYSPILSSLRNRSNGARQ